MWKRDEAVRQPAQPAVPTNEAAAAAPAAAAQAVRPETMRSQNARDIVNIGKSIVIKGEVTGSEDLTIEGHVEGKIELRDHVLSVGSTGRVQAHIAAKSIIVHGQVTGNLTAAEKVEIRDKGSVEGDIVAPRVAIADGANFRGSIDMRRDEPGTTPERAGRGR